MNRMKVFTLVAMLALAISPVATSLAQENTTPPQPQNGQPQDSAAQAPAGGDDVVSKACLIMGHDLFQSYNEYGLKLDVEALIQGIGLAAEGKDLPIAEEESMIIVQTFNRKLEACREEVMKKEMAKRAESAPGNLERGEAFMLQNSQVEGVRVLESGVQYRVVQEGSGASPALTDFVMVHYTGKLVDGTVFDSSSGKGPVRFPVGGVIRGMTEVLQKMKVGEKCQMVIPPALAYGAGGQGPIGPNETLIFDVELVSIE